MEASLALPPVSHARHIHVLVLAWTLDEHQPVVVLEAVWHGAVGQEPADILGVERGRDAAQPSPPRGTAAAVWVPHGAQEVAEGLDDVDGVLLEVGQPQGPSYFSQPRQLSIVAAQCARLGAKEHAAGDVDGPEVGECALI